MPDTASEQEHSRRYAWVTVSRNGNVAIVPSVGEYEMRQLQELCDGPFSQVPTSKLADHKLCLAIKNAVANDANTNHAFSSWYGLRVVGTVVVGQRRATETGFGKQRDGRRYMVPFLRTEAEQVERELKQAIGTSK